MFILQQNTDATWWAKVLKCAAGRIDHYSFVLDLLKAATCGFDIYKSYILASKFTGRPSEEIDFSAIPVGSYTRKVLGFIREEHKRFRDVLCQMISENKTLTQESVAAIAKSLSVPSFKGIPIDDMDRTVKELVRKVYFRYAIELLEREDNMIRLPSEAWLKKRTLLFTPSAANTTTTTQNSNTQARTPKAFTTTTAAKTTTAAPSPVTNTTTTAASSFGNRNPPRSTITAQSALRSIAGRSTARSRSDKLRKLDAPWRSLPGSNSSTQSTQAPSIPLPQKPVLKPSVPLTPDSDIPHLDLNDSGNGHSVSSSISSSVSSLSGLPLPRSRSSRPLNPKVPPLTPNGSIPSSPVAASHRLNAGAKAFNPSGSPSSSPSPKSHRLNAEAREFTPPSPSSSPSSTNSHRLNAEAHEFTPSSSSSPSSSPSLPSSPSSTSKPLQSFNPDAEVFTPSLQTPASDSEAPASEAPATEAPVTEAPASVSGPLCEPATSSGSPIGAPPGLSRPPSGIASPFTSELLDKWDNSKPLDAYGELKLLIRALVAGQRVPVQTLPHVEYDPRFKSLGEDDTAGALLPDPKIWGFGLEKVVAPSAVSASVENIGGFAGGFYFGGDDGEALE